MSVTTATCNDLADYHWLTGDEAGRLLAELAADPAPLHTSVARLRQRLSPSRAHLAIEQVELRRRAAAKFTHADRMFFTRTTLEQATDEWVAQYKTARFLQQQAGASPPSTIADLCCGIGGDLLALAHQCTAIGFDLNPIAAHLAAANVRSVLNRDVEVRVADVADFDLGGITAWHIDPDRRPGARQQSQVNRRTTSLDRCTPNRATIDRLLAKVPHAAVKLAPATEVPVQWARSCEREWISRGGECRQQIAWHGDLAIAPGLRRATVINSLSRYCAERLGAGRPRTLTGSPNQFIPITAAPARYIFDVDPAVLAAHLTGVLAAEHNLHALAAGPTYLTGDAPITDDAALACFEVLELLSLRIRTLAQHLRTLGIGTLEIKKRGVETDPDQLRRELKLHGDNSATLLITTTAGRPVAFLAQRNSQE